MSVFYQEKQLDKPTMIGAITLWAGNAAPDGWVLCQGQTLQSQDADGNPTVYAPLYKILGTTYGSGTEAGSFKVPDLRTYYVVGANSTNRNTTLSATSAVDGHSLTISEIPSHNHGITDPGHKHTYSKCTFTHTSGKMAGNYWVENISTQNTSSVTTGITLGNTGSGSSHGHNISSVELNALCLNYIIKIK